MTDFAVYALTDQQRTAMRAFMDHPDYEQRPCVEQPQRWDEPAKVRGARNKQRERERAEHAAILCITSCPVFDACDQVRAAGVADRGVVAGHILAPDEKADDEEAAA